MTKYFYISAIIASLGGFLCGYDTGVISGALLYIEQSFKTNSAQIGLLVSSISLGAVIGAFVNGFLIDKIGRKKTILISAFFFFIGSLLCYLSTNIQILILSRLITGIAVGVASFAGPLYLSEISNKTNRGKIVSLHQISITLGILFAYCSNYFLSNFNDNWRLMLLAGIIPSFILFVCFIFLKDTPRWLVLKNRENEAKRVLTKYSHMQNVKDEINEIKATLFQSEKIKFAKNFVKTMFIGIGIMFVQIATGINAIIYFAPVIFKQIGFATNENALFVTIFIGIINFLMTFVAFAFVDKLGRKPLLYLGLSGMIFGLSVLSFSFNTDYFIMKYFALIACCIYIVSFSMSLGPVALLIISEIFPLRYRGSAMSIAIICNFLFNFAVTAVFPILMENLKGTVTFSIFNIICILSILFIFLFVPETKNLSLEELEQRYNAIG